MALNEEGFKTIESNIRVKQVDCRCNRCSSGELEFNGQVDRVSATKNRYSHSCTNCGIRQWLDNEYPYLVYEKIKVQKKN